MAFGTGAITKMADKLEKAQTRIKSMREKGEVVATRGVKTALVIGGGAAVGAIRGMWGDPAKGGAAKIPGTEIDADLAAGAVMTLAGLTDMAGKASDNVLDFGAGMLAVVTAQHVEKGIKDYEAQHPRKR